MSPALERGDLVQYQYDTGAFGYTTLYGKVIKAGKVTATILWESGNRNRVRQGWREVSIAKDQDGARKALAKNGEAS